MKLYVVGIDEAGRGPLAGPVAVGAVMFYSDTNFNFKGLTDSKKLTPQGRQVWFEKIKQWQSEGKLRYSVSLVSHTIIDKKGVVSAVKVGIKRCLKKLEADSEKVQVFLDGSLYASKEYKKQLTIIKGDEKIPVISLASIAAKVTRDKKMVELSKKYPLYGFEIHKGYGTFIHRKAIQNHGLSKIHRKTFCGEVISKK